jgi:hypothetical protein
MERDEGFRVTDRRRQVEEREEARPTPQSSAPPKPGAATPPPREPATAPAATERSLAGLFMMLASGAAVALGAAPDPMTGQTHRDLDQAAEAIDLLLLLREKTEGHRSLEESQILDELLYDLQLRYVSAKKSGR